MRNADVAVVGAGFGGLATALRLAELGADVVLCETLRYPGGCASTFTRNGYQFEAGATLFSGLGEGQLFGDWNQRWSLGLQYEVLDPVVELRTDSWSLAIPPDPEAFLDRFCGLPGANPESIRRFFSTQREVADALWKLFDDPSLLPPLSGTSILRHLARTPSYAPVLRWIRRSLGDVVRHHRLDDWEPLVIYLDAVSQITVQARASEAEAPFAMAAVDYFFRGTGHVHGGIGQLAWALVDAIQRAGGHVSLANRVKGIHREQDLWRLETRKGAIHARNVVANVLPQTMAKMVTPPLNGALRDIERAVEDGWGAAMLYFAVDQDAPDWEGAHHLQLVNDRQVPFQEGNHVFCSISGSSESDRAPDGQRTVTASTHVPMAKLLSMSPSQQSEYVATVQESMRETIRKRAGSLSAGLCFEATASPRTFERFTGRHLGYVGGIPRRVGLRHYRPRSLFPREADRGLYAVGDSVLLGQSTLAVALGGVRTAELIAKRDT